MKKLSTHSFSSQWFGHTRLPHASIRRRFCHGQPSIGDNPKSNARFVKVFARQFLNAKDFDKGCKEHDRMTSSFLPSWSN
ncbi:MAG: hypothetical protein NC113_08135 [Bacteroides sp.]|nr:hypothetical protein [Bacteroides sp.]